MVRYPNNLFWILLFTFLSAFILLAWQQGVAVARGKAAKGRFVSVYIIISDFTEVQFTERIFISLKKTDVYGTRIPSPHFKTSSVRAAALDKLTTLLDHEAVEQVRTKFHSLRTFFNPEKRDG